MKVTLIFTFACIGVLAIRNAKKSCGEGVRGLKGLAIFFGVLAFTSYISMSLI